MRNHIRTTYSYTSTSYVAIATFFFAILPYSSALAQDSTRIAQPNPPVGSETTSLSPSGSTRTATPEGGPSNITPAPLLQNIAISGFLHTDWQIFSRDIRRRNVNDVSVRRIRVEFAGVVNDYVSFRIVPDLAGSRVSLTDAYVDVAASRVLKLRVGKAKVPFSLERAQSTPSAIFIEQGATLLIAPNYDIGVQLLGDVFSNVFSYNFGVFDGVTDGQSQDNDSDDSKDIAGRIQITPFARQKNLLTGLTFGGGATYGTVHGTSVAPQVSSYRSAGQSTFLSYLSGVTADGTRVRTALYGAYYGGPLSLFSEWVRSSQEFTTTTGTPPAPIRTMLADKAYQVYSTFVLTGEATSFRGVTPRRPFSPAAGHWGAVELAARYDRFQADDATRAPFVDLSQSATSATSYTAGLNWYFTKKVRAELNYQYTHFENGAAGGGNREPERAILSRLQAVF